MSTFETKTSDNFIFEELLDPRESLSQSTPFLRKNVAYVVDQQAGNGSYTNGEVIIDSSSISASGNAIDWRNAYLAVPFQTKWDLAWGGTTGTVTNPAYAKYVLAMKNCSLVDSLKVEANGKTIITATSGLSRLVNFKLLSTMTPSQLVKDGATIGFYPDDEGTIGDGGNDVINVANDPNATTTLTDKAYVANAGLVARQQNFLPCINSNFLGEANALEEGSTWDYGSQTIDNSTTPQTPSDIHWVATIRLKDLHDYFDKHPMSRGVSYRFTLRFNQAITTVSHTSSSEWSSSLASTATFTHNQLSGTAQPAQFCIGNGTMFARTSWVTPVTAQSVITHRIDTTPQTRFSGIRLYVPSYELDPVHQEKLLSSSPVMKSQFMDFMTATTQQFAAAGAAINVQVSTSATNPRALVVIPRWSQTATGSGGQGFYSDISPFTTAPATPDPLLSLTNLQIKMGNTFVLPDRLYYSFQQFIDNLSSIFALNGNETALTSGLISKKSFETVHRYYAFDLSRYPEAMNNLPQMISLECKNNSTKAIELECILLYGRDAEYNFASGSMTITA